jgi:hypothetical protein
MFVKSCLLSSFAQKYRVMLGIISTWEILCAECVVQEHFLWAEEFCLTHGMNYQKDFIHKLNLSIPLSVHFLDMIVKSTVASKILFILSLLNCCIL